MDNKMDNKLNNMNEEELTPEEVNAVSGGAPVGTPKRPRFKRTKPTEESENNGATGNW